MHSSVSRVAGCECCLLCRQAAWRHRVVSSCSALPVSGRLAWAADMGRSCQAAWQGRWLHLAVKLLGGRVHFFVGVDKLFGGTERQSLRAVIARDLCTSCEA